METFVTINAPAFVVVHVCGVITSALNAVAFVDRRIALGCNTDYRPHQALSRKNDLMPICE